MTNKQGVPKALHSITRYEVVDCIDSKHVPAVIPKPHGPWVRYEDHAAQVAALTAAPQGVAYAELPEPIWRTAQGVAFSERQLYDFAARTHALRASHGQAPAGAWIERWYGSGGKDGYEGWSIVNKDGRCLVAYLGRNVESGAVTEIVMAHNATLATTTAQAAPALAENGHLTQAGHDLLMEATLAGATLVSKGRFVGDMAQVAESAPAIQGEANVQLDTDPNTAAPGQHRNVAGSVALGQPMGHGPDQVAGHLGAQGDKLLTVAERNIRSFLRSAVFKSESDREAALSCVDVLWEAARAPADSVLEDAARWNEVLMHVGAANHLGGQHFTLNTLRIRDQMFLLRGSVAQHFTACIDDSLAARKQGETP